MIAKPEALERDSDLYFVNEAIKLETPLSAQILSIKPEHETVDSRWIAILASGDIVRINLSTSRVQQLVSISPSDLQLSDQVAIHLSPDNNFVAVVNDRQDLGVVINFTNSEIMMTLNRGEYHPEQTPFPVAFFQTDNRLLILHGTDWNRLDVSDIQTGELVTKRETPKHYKEENHLNYFHALPVISPNAEWIIEDGWVWDPVGLSRIWNLRTWVTQNVWESENGESVQNVNQRHYKWNAPICWIDDNTVAIWGFGNDDMAMLDGVQFLDARTGKRLRWFAGPAEGALYFDNYLFSTSSTGTDVWDIETGERLLNDSNLTPINYHPDTCEFLTLVDNNTFLLSRLVHQ